MKARRDFAWQIVHRVFAPVATSGGALPTWETWYEEEDIEQLYRALRAEPPAARKSTTIRATVQSLMARGVKNLQTTLTAQRFAKPLRQFARPEFRPATSRSTVGTGFIHYSPAYVEHFLVNSASIAACDLAHLRPSGATDGFALCMDSEMPSSAVMVKSMWVRIESGAHQFSTDAASMVAGLTAPASWTADPANATETWHGTWTDAGRQTIPPAKAFTTTDELGNVHALVAIHIATKDVRNWTWTTMWWTARDENLDFGADRLAEIVGDWPTLGSYKMCTTSGWAEEDANPAAAYDGKPGLETLASAIKAVNATMPRANFGRKLQWCANPNLEPDLMLGNCVSCHLGSPTRLSPVSVFGDLNASDLSFSFTANQAAIRAIDASATRKRVP
jgi:hypothetical protein